mmetsp:Transcript_17249/g.39656  ORF Transcript_17249/g.39656 Transcript_17249/m.39656 type:complete len:302 (+) Transcript_17249:1794-2699(+)
MRLDQQCRIGNVFLSQSQDRNGSISGDHGRISGRAVLARGNRGSRHCRCRCCRRCHRFLPGAPHVPDLRVERQDADHFLVRLADPVRELLGVGESLGIGAFVRAPLLPQRQVVEFVPQFFVVFPDVVLAAPGVLVVHFFLSVAGLGSTTGTDTARPGSTGISLLRVYPVDPGRRDGRNGQPRLPVELLRAKDLVAFEVNVPRVLVFGLPLLDQSRCQGLALVLFKALVFLPELVESRHWVTDQLLIDLAEPHHVLLGGHDQQRGVLFPLADDGGDRGLAKSQVVLPQEMIVVAGKSRESQS